jgi:hypothetical protein
MPFSTGLSGLIRLAANAELESGVSLETIFIGAPPNSISENYEWQACGSFLLYGVALAGAEIRVSAALLDSIGEPQFLLKMPDCEDGWRVAFAFISSLERYQVQDLTKPIQVGDPTIHDPHTCWIVA